MHDRQPGTWHPLGERQHKADFDGWGYVAPFGTDVPRSPNQTTGSITQINTHAVAESQGTE